MAKIKEIEVTRKFNLGNYQTLDIGLVATVGEGEDVAQVARALDQKIVEIRNKKIDLNA